MQKILPTRAISVLSLAATVLFVVLVYCTPAFAQSQTTGAITGVVTDPSGAVVPNAPVVLKDIDRGTTQETHTSTSGVYRFDLLIPGNYSVSVSASGFATLEQTTEVSVGQVSTVNVKLELSTGKQTLVVTEAATALETENPNISDTITQTQITELPNPGNDMSYIAQIAAGSTMNTQAGYGNFSSFGLPATSNLFTLDGMDDNDPFLNLNNSGATNLLLGQNEIQETSVVSNSYTGEYGSLAGANINYITKGGSNKFHGNANYEWNGSSLNSNDWFNNSSGTAKPFSNANQWGGSIGGPIKKDKAFFFFDTEGLIVLLPTSTPTSVPTAAFESEVIANLNAAGLSNSVPFYQQMFNLYNSAPGASAARDVLAPGATVATPATDTTPAIASVPTPDGCSTYLPTTFTGPCAVQFRSVAGNETHERIYAGRVDFNFGSNDRMFVRYQQDHGFQATYTDPISPIFNLGSTQPEYQSQLTETHTFGTSAVNQLIIFGQWYSAIFGPKSQSAAVAAFPASLWLGDNTLYPLGFYNFFWPQGRNVTQYGFSDDFSKSKGAHSLKFGVKYRRNDVSDQDYGYYVNPYLLPFSLADFANGGIGIQQNCGNTCGDLSVQNFPLSLNQPMATWGLGAYAQDAWKVKPNLTVNFALRIEHNSNPVCQHDCFARLTGPWNEIAHDPATPYNQALLVSQHQALSGLQSIVWEPRIGFSWQPLGASRNTVIRGGIGIFGDAFPAGVADNFSSNPPLLNSFTIYNDNLSPVETSNLFNDAASSNQSFLSGFKAGQTVDQIEAENPNFSPPSMTVSDKQTKVPTYEKWSMEIEHGFGEHATFSVSYVGNHGYHETVANAAVNAYESGFSGLPSAPPDSRFGPVGWITTAGTSSYNGLTASLRAQTHSATVLLNYTWSHGFDTVSNGGLLPFNYSTNLSPLSPMNPYNIQANRADSDYDVRHYLSASYVWQLPFKGLTRGHGPAALVNGWQVSGTIFTRTGLPYTPYDGSDGAGIYNYGAAQLYANFNGGTVSSCSSPQNPCLTATQFSSAATGFGNVLRNSFRGPGYFDTDFSLLKYTNIPHWEGAKLAVGAQAYNVFNHPNFDIPDANIDSSTFGTVIHTVGSPTSILGAFLGGDASVRMIQLTARIVF